mgnify:CR=1 FL=1
MPLRTQEIIATAVEARDTLAGSDVLKIPFIEQNTDSSVLLDVEGKFDRGGGSDLAGTYSGAIAEWYVDELFELRRTTAASLARLLDPSVAADELLEAACSVRDRQWGGVVSFSPKVFIDLTRLCRDRCAYCTFIRDPLSPMPSSPRNEDSPLASELPVRDRWERPEPYLLHEEVLAIATVGRKAGCTEALFTLGDRPEEKYPAARKFLQRMGYDSTAHYLYDCARLVIEETGLLPHVNPGVMTRLDLRSYKEVAASCGMMLESTSYALFADPRGCHFECPDKYPPVRVATIQAAEVEKVPFTTGILIGIGESLQARADTLLVLASLAVSGLHIQEVIVQNFRAKPSIPMSTCPEPTDQELARTVALARLLLPPSVAVQAPPNLSPGNYASLLGAGVCDWGGISPVTLDHVNPEAAWPEISAVKRATEERGFELRARLCVYPSFVRSNGWISERVKPYVDALADSEGWASVFGPLAAELGCAPIVAVRDASIDRMSDRRE